MSKIGIAHDKSQLVMKFVLLRGMVRNNSTRWRRIMVCLQGTSTFAYPDTCGWM